MGSMNRSNSQEQPQKVDLRIHCALPWVWQLESHHPRDLEGSVENGAYRSATLKTRSRRRKALQQLVAPTL